MELFKRAAAEFAGTFFILFFGLSMIIVEQIKRSSYDSLVIAFAFAAPVVLMVLVLGKMSGAHYNPAVTIGFFSVGKMTLREMLAYIGAQCTAGVFAGFILTVMFIRNADLGYAGVDLGLLGARSEMPTEGIISLIEFVISFLLMFAYIYCTGRKSGKLKSNSPAIIGLVYFISLLAFYKLTGAGLNPLKILVPALFAWKWNYAFYFVGAELVGAVAGAVTARFFLRK